MRKNAYGQRFGKRRMIFRKVHILCLRFRRIRYDDEKQTPEDGGEAEEDGFSLLKDLFAPCGAKEDAT